MILRGLEIAPKHILQLYARAIMTQALQVVTVTGDRDGDIDLTLNWASQDTQIIITNSNRMSTSYIIILKTYF